MQLLSEPSGGSDVAGALTTAVRDGDEWILNGSKVWTTGAWWSDWGLCLARTNWDVPKHRGLTVFMLPLHQAGVEVQQIEMLNGSKEFCQEFLTDVRVPDQDRIGEVDDGWTVGHAVDVPRTDAAQLAARDACPPSSCTVATDCPTCSRSPRRLERMDDPVVRDLIGEVRMLEVVREQLLQRVAQGIVDRRDARPVFCHRAPVPRRRRIPHGNDRLRDRGQRRRGMDRSPTAAAGSTPVMTSSCGRRRASAAAPPRWLAT